jgi:hypothetical protein
VVLDRSLGADCVLYDAVFDKETSRAAGFTHVQRERAFLCPHPALPHLLTIRVGERYLMGGRSVLSHGAIRQEVERLVRSVVFTPVE